MRTVRWLTGTGGGSSRALWRGGDARARRDRTAGREMRRVVRVHWKGGGEGVVGSVSRKLK